MGDASLDPPPRRGVRRLLGIDRSGPAPPQTRAGAPLHPWTVPNLIGFLRIALIVVFVIVALRSSDGRSGLAATVFAVAAGSDYADGLAARLTGQYSRLGTILDPLVDRALILAGVAVCWDFSLLPRWAIGVLAARELLMLIASQVALRRGLPLEINWLGRASVWPLMAAIFFALAAVGDLARVLLYIGIALSLAATVLYLRTGLRELRPDAASS
ncbi:MAG: CDP-alcohol phosphatidyltransferase family protein [Actinobacteria bacterium]|nr:MAG: CDP-alcohol phosphatidyltransferase family protein [Actinomycetota bacterium]